MSPDGTAREWASIALVIVMTMAYPSPVPIYATTCIDVPEGAALRGQAREPHTAYVQAQSVKMLAVGPLFGEDGQMIGSLSIIEADDLAAMQAFYANDPYQLAGVYADVQISQWLDVVGPFAKR